MGRPKKNTSVITSKTHPIVGTKYILPDSNPMWGLVLRKLKKAARVYGFSRIELPVAEEVKVYEKFAGIVPEVIDSANVPVAEDVAVKLRSALLPSVFQAYSSFKLQEENKLHKWFYLGNVMRSVQGGLESSYEFGFEVLGPFSHLTEAQVMGAVWNLLNGLGFEGSTLEINTIGSEACQASYQSILTDYFRNNKFQLCDNCNEHIGGRSLNILRCTNSECTVVASEAPTILDYLDQSSHKNFTNILEALDEMQVPYQLNPLYVGSEGSSGTNFVVKIKHKDKLVVFGEGAHHSTLLAQYAGKTATSFGFAGNLQVLVDALQASELEIVQEYSTEVFLVPLGELASKRSLRLFHDLLASHISVYDHFGDVGVKNQLKQAEVYKAPIALIIGQKEAVDDMVILRDVKSGMQEIFSYDKIVSEVKKRLGK